MRVSLVVDRDRQAFLVDVGRVELERLALVAVPAIGRAGRGQPVVGDGFAGRVGDPADAAGLAAVQVSAKAGLDG